MLQRENQGGKKPLQSNEKIETEEEDPVRKNDGGDRSGIRKNDEKEAKE